jgi:F0F1-type ATP synthase assembly protein I
MVYNCAGLRALANANGNDQGKSTSQSSGAMKSLVQVESLVQLALMLPVGTVVGWAIGLGLDKWLHQHWIYIPGLILGAAAGFVEIFRVVFKQMKD